VCFDIDVNDIMRKKDERKEKRQLVSVARAREGFTTCELRHFYFVIEAEHHFLKG